MGNEGRGETSQATKRNSSCFSFFRDLSRTFPRHKPQASSFVIKGRLRLRFRRRLIGPDLKWFGERESRRKADRKLELFSGKEIRQIEWYRLVQCMAPRFKLISVYVVCLTMVTPNPNPRLTTRISYQFLEYSYAETTPTSRTVQISSTWAAENRL
jgi:hypothetical protein